MKLNFLKATRIPFIQNIFEVVFRKRMSQERSYGFPLKRIAPTVLTIKRKNQPVLEAFQKRKTEEQKAIDDYIDENY